jgi:hypothetical protein
MGMMLFFEGNLLRLGNVSIELYALLYILYKTFSYGTDGVNARSVWYLELYF